MVNLPQRGSQRDAGGRSTETDAAPQTAFSPPTRVSPSLLSLPLTFSDSGSYRRAGLCVQTQIPPHFRLPIPSVTSQNPSLISAQLLGVALSVHTAVGLAWEVQSAHCDLFGAFVTDERQAISGVQ